MRKNKIITLFEIVYNFLLSLFESIIIFSKQLFLWKRNHLLKENKFLDILNFIFHTGPKSFWKKPTWIKIWRSIATLLHYTFDKEDKFREIKK